MNDCTPRLARYDDLPRRVLVVAAHPGDEVLGCGGMIAAHAARGDVLKILVLSNGGARGGREAESRAAAARLGKVEIAFQGLPEGKVGGESQLVGLLERELAAFAPELVYAPAPSEPQLDARAVSRALIAALASRPGVRMHLYGTGRQVAANVLYDTSAHASTKDAAIACFATLLAEHDLVEKSRACDRAWTMGVSERAVVRAEGFVDLSAAQGDAFAGRSASLEECLARPGEASIGAEGEHAATAVISSWNKRADVRENLAALRAQTRPFDRIVVVDNASNDGTVEMIRAEFPEVHLVVMPHSRYGACETFNIGFANSRTPLTAILDDDVVLPPEWLEKAVERLAAEPSSTAILSTKVVEPGMPESFKSSPAINRERYMSTFRGCASLARTQALREAGGYDERLFIYGNERDLTCRLLNLGYRVLQYPGVHVFHKTPFGIKMGKRSLYYHARNAWIAMLKYAPLPDLLRMPVLVFSKVVLRSAKAEAEGEVTDATGTIGISRALRETPGAWWILTKAAASVVYNVPYCLKRREPVRASDFELPVR